MRAKYGAGVVILSLFLACPAAAVTGDPVADGWQAAGHSLANGVYVRGSANFGFEVYSAAITVTPGSILEISDGAKSWLAGDLVLGVGGRFANITAAEAGWAGFTGGAVNNLLGEGTKLIAKFGSAHAAFSPSTIAPNAGNGVGSTASGGTGTVFVRTSGWFYAADWAAGSGQLMPLNKPTHISREGAAEAPDPAVARLMWIWDAQKGHVISWEILLNVSLLDRLQPELIGTTPAPGNLAIASVQYRDSDYTDAFLTLAPEPLSLSLVLTAGSLTLLRRKSRRIGV